MSLKDIVKKEYIENDENLCFKTTPITKILILSIVTGGIYDIILSLNYWKTLKENFGYKVSPFWRGWFVMFTNFKLFPIFEKYFETYNVKLYAAGSGAGLLAGVYFICSWFDAKLSIRTAMLETINWSFEIIMLILEIITALIFVFIQNKINKINEQYYPKAPKNPWKVSNTIWTIICLTFIVLTYIPYE